MSSDKLPEISYYSPKCVICNDSYDEGDKKPLVLVNCGHSFCKNCVLQFSNKKCPVCRLDYDKYIENWLVIEILSQTKCTNPIKPFTDKFIFVIDENLSLTIQKFESLKKQIDTKFEEVVKQIKRSQISLIEELEVHENKLMQRYDDVKKELEQSAKLFDENISSNLNYNYEDKLIKIKFELTRLEAKFGSFKLVNCDDDFTFIENLVEINENFLGALKLKSFNSEFFNKVEDNKVRKRIKLHFLK